MNDRYKTHIALREQRDAYNRKYLDQLDKLDLSTANSYRGLARQLMLAGNTDSSLTHRLLTQADIHDANRAYRVFRGHTQKQCEKSAAKRCFDGQFFFRKRVK